MKLKGSTFGETLGPAMDITDQVEADDYFEQLIKHYMTCQSAKREGGRSRVVAEQIVRESLGYYAGYYNDKTQKRVNCLFRTTHPVFGDTKPRPEEAFEAGKKLGRQLVEEGRMTHRTKGSNHVR